MKKFDLAKSFENNRFAVVFSLLVAILLYIFVAMTTNDSRDYVIHNVPVDLDLQAANLTNRRLNVIEGDEYFVDVTINGPRTRITQLKADSPEMATTARINNITEPGEYNLAVTSAYSGDLSFKIVSYSPRYITVRLDRYRTSSFDIEPVTRGVSTAPGYIYDSESVSPAKVSVTGPELEVAKIARAEVSLDLTDPLEQTHAPTVPIVLRDAQGEEIDLEESHLTLNITEAQLVITVLRETGVPLEVKFINAPRDFPEDLLREQMEMSTDYVHIASTSDVIERLTEITVGYIDLKTLRPGNSSFTFSLGLDEISDQIKSLDNLTSVNVFFNEDTWDTASFNISEISLINVPADYNIALLTESLAGIELVGDATALQNMTAGDIVAEVDFSERQITSGQQYYPVRISAPGRGLVWAVDDHSVLINVVEKE